MRFYLLFFVIQCLLISIWCAPYNGYVRSQMDYHTTYGLPNEKPNKMISYTFIEYPPPMATHLSKVGYYAKIPNYHTEYNQPEISPMDYQRRPILQSMLLPYKTETPFKEVSTVPETSDKQIHTFVPTKFPEFPKTNTNDINVMSAETLHTNINRNTPENLKPLLYSEFLDKYINTTPTTTPSFDTRFPTIDPPSNNIFKASDDKIPTSNDSELNRETTVDKKGIFSLNPRFAYEN